MEVITNKDIIQSYILTVAKYDSNIYVKRILTHIVTANQDYVKGVKFKGGIILNIEEDLFKDREYTLNAKELLLNDKDKNYKRIYDAFDYLQGKFIAFEDDDIRFRVPFITAVYARKNDGTIRFRMSELIHRAFTDYTKGYRKYELKVSLSLTSVYSIRFYELMSEQVKPLTYTIEYLKERFNIEGKYKRVNDFYRFVIDPAKKELDEKSPYTFEYKINKKGRAHYSITFYPVKQKQFADENIERKNLQKQLSTMHLFDRQTKDYLVRSFGFNNQQIKQHYDLFERAVKEINIMEFIEKVRRNMRKAGNINNPAGYFVNALKSELKQ